MNWGREDPFTDTAFASHHNFWRADEDETVLICTLCGCMVSARFATEHRGRCGPTAESQRVEAR